jgi:hypothetical protein
MEVDDVAEHTKNKTPSNKPKHEKSQAKLAKVQAKTPKLNSKASVRARHNKNEKGKKK